MTNKQEMETTPTPEALARLIEELGQLEIGYGDLAFWIAIVKKAEHLPDNISLAEFYSILNRNHSRKAFVKLIDPDTEAVPENREG